jgi:TolB protein
VFASDQDYHGNHFHLRLLNIASGSSREISNGSLYEFDPSWSPDGSRLAFTQWEDPGFAEVWEWRQPDHARRVTRPRAGAEEPSWSPEGRRLVVTMPRKGAADLAVIRLDGSLAHWLTSHPANDIDPDWAP